LTRTTPSEPLKPSTGELSAIPGIRSPDSVELIANDGVVAGCWNRGQRRITNPRADDAGLTAARAGHRDPALLAIFLDAGRPQPGEAVAINQTLPGEKFLDRQHIAAAASSSERSPPRTAATTSAFRRITQRVVPGGGRSATVSGLPSGPRTYFLGRKGSVMLFSRYAKSRTNGACYALKFKDFSTKNRQSDAVGAVES
jgi:hypothetical protein